jgi:hypothetical protein
MKYLVSLCYLANAYYEVNAKDEKTAINKADEINKDIARASDIEICDRYDKFDIAEKM